MRRLAPLLLALALAPASCGEDEGAAPTTAAPEPGQASPARPAADLDAFVAAPTVEGLLALLGQSHRAAREALGPHRIQSTADLALRPPGDLPRPIVDGPAPAPQVVHDDLLLVWAGKDDRDLRLHLRQGPDEAGARELVIIGEDVHTRLPYRTFLRRELDSDVHWLWLDDAFHHVHDLVELAAPSLVVSLAGDADGLVHVELTRSESADPTRVATGLGREWRAAAAITAIEGTLDLDRRAGIWRRADLRVAYTTKDAAGNLLQGEARLHAELTPDPALTVEAPARSAALPTRPRYDDERRHLLDGLAR